MRKNKGNVKRILALILAFALVLGNVGVSFADEISGEEKIEALAEAQEEAKVAEDAQVVEDAEEVPKAKADAETAKGEKAEEAESEKKDFVKALSEEAAAEEAGEASAQKLEFENDDVKITVSEEKAGVIPAGVNLKVTPIRKGDKANEEEGILGYEDVEKKLNEKAAGEEYEIAGFLAYDIKLVDKDGNEVEPSGEVKVSMEYKKAGAPEGVDAETVKDADVTVMHLEEDEKGDVKEVVDLSEVVPEGKTEKQAENKVEKIEKDKKNAVEKAEFVTGSFSVYSITWNVMNSQAAVFQNEKDYIFYVQSGNDYYALSYDGRAVKLPSNVSPSTGFYGINEIQDTAFEGNPDYRNILWTCDFLSAQKATFNNVGNGTKYIALNNNGVTEDVAEGVSPETIVFEYSGEAISRAAGYLHNNATGGLYLNYDSNQKKFTTVNSKSNTCKVYVARVEKLPSGTPQVIPDSKKVTNSDVGITMNVFDYYGATTGDDANKHGGGLDTWQNHYGSRKYLGINSGNRQLLFFGYGTPAGKKVKKDDWNRDVYDQYSNHTDSILVDINSYADTGVDRATQGIVENKLGTDGYPVLQSRNKSSYQYQHLADNSWKSDTVNVTTESLAYLFNPTTTVTGKTTYANVDGLLQKDSDGFYYYDSDYNYAELNTTTKKFTLYDRTYLTRTGDDGVQHPIGFFPFNNYDATKTDIGCNAYRENDGKPKYNEEKKNNNAYNHHFGMTMSAKFVLGNEGKYNGKDTVYHFSGDDDMWVYIDDVLVLDIGGIHEPVDGYINFATGEVVVEGACTVGDYYDNPTGTTRTTLTQIFSDAGKTWNGAVNSVHTIKTFYMERGGQYSNLSLSFNLQIIPEKTNLTVEKKWRDGDNTAIPGNYEVKVQLLADGQPVNNGAVILNNTNGWSKTFTDLDKYKEVNGTSQLIVYSFREEYVHDRDKQSGKAGYDLTDKYTPFLTTVDNGKTTTITIENVKKKAKMTVSKTFKGLKWSQIQELMSSRTVDGVAKPAFGITITSKADPSITKTLTLNGTDPAPVITYIDSAGDKKTIKLSDRSTYPTDDAVRPYTFLWTVEGLEQGDYTVSENGQEYQGYTVTVSGTGDVSIKLENWTVIYQGDYEATNSATECDIHDWLLKENGIIAMSLTSNSGYLIYSQKELTNTQELKIIDMINKKQQPFTTFRTGNGGAATTSNTRFYYNDQLNKDKNVNPNGHGIVYVDKTNEIFHFGATDIWQHVLLGEAEWINVNGTDTKDADINVSNAYEPLVNLDLEKVSTSDSTLKLTGAEFELYYKADANGTYAIVTAAEGKYTPLKDADSNDRNAFEVSNSTDADSEDLKNLKPGFYYLKEIKAPAGYSLLTEELYFKVVFDSTTNKYKPEKCDANGNASTSTSYDLKGTTLVMQIKNAPLYSLPSTGGIGIYLPTFVGALLMAFALFLYDRRRVAVRIQ